MSEKQVDVLAVMNAICDGEFDKPGKPSFTDAHKALAAMARLIATAKQVDALSIQSESHLRLRLALRDVAANS